MTVEQGRLAGPGKAPDASPMHPARATPSGGAISGGGPRVAELVRLQQTLGNRAVSRLLADVPTERLRPAQAPPVLGEPVKPLRPTTMSSPRLQRDTPGADSAHGTDFTATHGSGYAPALDDEGKFLDEDMLWLEQNAREEIAEEKGIKESAVFDGEVRMRMLAPRVAQAEQQRLEAEREALAEDDDASVLGVFLGPEWFFKRAPKPYSEKERERIIAMVEALSSTYPKLLIVPGTIVWRKPGSGPQGPLRKKAEMGNLAPVVFDGRCIHRIEKQALAGDTVGYAPPGAKNIDSNTKIKATREYLRHSEKLQDNTSFFTIGNVKFSLEICGDHSSGKRAARELAEHPPFAEDQKADVQLLVAHGAGFVKPGSGQTVREGGVAYSIDAAPSTNDSGTFGSVTTGTNTKASKDTYGRDTTVMKNERTQQSYGMLTADMGVWGL